MRFYYANQPAAILIGLLSVAIVVALAAVFLPLISGSSSSRSVPPRSSGPGIG